jgi:hypothetical protein
MDRQFTQNYRDHSSGTGFQFEFFCDRCRSGHRSQFRTHKLGIVTSVLKALSAMVGGATARAGYGADHMSSAFRGSAWSKAYRLAVEECGSRLRQCPRCAKWVCGEACWSPVATACRICAPADPAKAA